MSQTSEPLITLRPARRADAPTIIWLEEVCMKDYAMQLWGSWQASDTPETLNLSTHEMVEHQSNSIGCIATQVKADAFQLGRLYFAPEARNQGFGAAVLAQIIARADAKGLPVRLRVLTNNPAVRFYARHGFQTERQTKEHIYMIRPRTRDTQ